MNKAIMVGRLAKDPDVRTTQSGKKVANITLATDRRMRDKEGKKVADFHSVILWGKLAELAEKYLSKGEQISIVGEIQNRTWEDKDGNKRYITEIAAEEIHFLTPNGGKAKAVDEDRMKGFEEVKEETLPF